MPNNNVTQPCFMRRVRLRSRFASFAINWMQLFIRRGSCVFCGEAEETARHIVECALNPLLSRIMELPANEREWLSNPVAETELPPAAIERLSGLHLEIWRCRQHTRREREDRSEYEQYDQ